MSFLDALIGLVLFGGFALGGRWVRLHPEKVFGEGHFNTEKSWRQWEKLIVAMGTFAVLGGTACGTRSLLALVTFNRLWLEMISTLVAIVCGVLAARYVQREAKVRPPHVSKNPYGWWP
jgi:uncharacterized membrane protein